MKLFLTPLTPVLVNFSSCTLPLPNYLATLLCYSDHKAAPPLLDVGWLFGQDLRLLALDSAPVLECGDWMPSRCCGNGGLQLFGDPERFGERFKEGDILDPGTLDGLSPVDLVLASQVFHLF